MSIDNVYAYFTLARNADFFTLDDPVKGVLDNGTYLLVGTTQYDITPDAFRITCSRGRTSRLTEDIPPGIATITFYNLDRTYDPQHAASPYIGNVLPGRKIELTVDSYQYFNGFVEDWNFEYSPDGMSTATAVVVDALGELARMEMGEWTTTSQLPGERIRAVLDRPEVDYGYSGSIDDGVFELQADTISAGTNVLNYLQGVARADFGSLLASRFGGVQFQDRRTLTSTVPFAFGDYIPFHGISARYGSEELYNRVSVARVGGTPQVVTDQDSADLYGWRSLSLSGLLLESDADALAYAKYLLSRYKQPVWRVSSITVHVHALERNSLARYFVTNVDIGEAFDVVWTPNGVGDPITSRCVIEGIQHDAAPMQHTITFHMGDADLRSQFRLDLDDVGELDGTSVLSF